MAADLAADREQRAWAEAARELRLDLFEFADDERFDDEAGTAATQFWNGYYTADTLPLMSPSEAERFFDWFTFDYTLPSGDRVVDLYHDEQGDELPTPQRELLDRWAATGPMGGYELTGYDRQTLRLKDVVSGEEVDVFEPAGHGNAPVGSIIIGRLVPVQDHDEFFSSPAFIPPDEIGEVREKLKGALSADAADGRADATRRHSVILVHHALDQAKAAGRPPVARLDPRHASDSVRRRLRHERVRIKGPNSVAETTPHLAQTHRKAI
jgi:hypothetical protein